MTLEGGEVPSLDLILGQEFGVAIESPGVETKKDISVEQRFDVSLSSESSSVGVDISCNQKFGVDLETGDVVGTSLDLDQDFDQNLGE